jgi:hypothetical protein
MAAESKPVITSSDNKTTFEVVIAGETYVFSGTTEIKFEKVIANPVDPDPVDPTPVDPTPKPTEQPELGTIKTGDKWSTNPGPADTWKVINMKDFPEQFKIIDVKGLNIMANIKTKVAAEALVNWFKTNPFPPKTENNPTPTPNPIDPNAKVDAQGVVMIYAPKAGGQVITANDTYQKESEHDGQSRTSLYSKSEYIAGSGELTEYFVMDLGKDSEQNAPKLLSGGHTGSGDSDTTRQGRCYAVGINQNGTLHLAKEYPKHPDTPKFYDKIKYVDPNWRGLGQIANKSVGMKIIYYPIEKDGKKGMHLEWWFDVKHLDTGKLENDWKQCAYADDFGDWEGEPYFENNGVVFNGKVLGFYIRIDTPKNPVQFKYQGCHELAIPVKKLV